MALSDLVNKAKKAIEDAQKSVKNLTEYDKTYLIRVDKEKVTPVLSEQKIQHTYLDWDSVQARDDFVQLNNPKIKYRPSDFIIEISNDVYTKLTENINDDIDFYEVKSFGWYNKKEHLVEMRIFESGSNKLSKLEEKNPDIKSNSFELLRNAPRRQEIENILNGALGLSYHCFKDNYNHFLAKTTRFEDNKWIINTNDLTTYDRQIIIQLFLYQANQETELIDKITDGSSSLQLYQNVLSQSLDYFVDENYSMHGYLEFIANKNSDNKEAGGLVKELFHLQSKLKKALPYDPKGAHVKYIDEFIKISKMDINELDRSINEDKSIKKTSIFLLGMLHLGDRLDDKFNFDELMPAVLALTIKHIKDIEIDGDEVRIVFDKAEFEKNRNNKFTLVKEYIDELRTIMRLRAEQGKLQENHQKREDIQEEIPAEEEAVEEASVEEPVEEAEDKYLTKEEMRENFFENLEEALGVNLDDSPALDDLTDEEKAFLIEAEKKGKVTQKVLKILREAIARNKKKELEDRQGDIFKPTKDELPFNKD